MDALPFSQACENNKAPILEVLSRVFADRNAVLEVASGTGQHATWFAGHLPHLSWQPTELPEHLPVLMPRCEHYAGTNLRPPLVLDVSQRPWPITVPTAIFSANSLHIMPFSSVEDFFAELGDSAPEGTLLAIYGPFNYNGAYTSESNSRFDQWLAQQSPYSAIRDFEAVNALAESAGFTLQEDNAMPANNRLVVWRS
ncbi:DUF938 domain-containing protein [Haliea sp. E17]|uniref:DUF938 domain-containing protein n=1 Tax=Haliea sp. E17 TaxID=3401576 RepID=UPI003AAEA30F